MVLGIGWSEVQTGSQSPGSNSLEALGSFKLPCGFGPPFPHLCDGDSKKLLPGVLVWTPGNVDWDKPQLKPERALPAFVSATLFTSLAPGRHAHQNSGCPMTISRTSTVHNGEDGSAEWKEHPVPGAVLGLKG